MPDPERAGATATRAVDAAFALWVAGWVAVAVWVAVDVAHLGELAPVVGTAAKGLGTFAGVATPFAHQGGAVGAAASTITKDLSDAARQLDSTTAELRSSISQLSVILGLAVAAIPIVPAAAVYVPFRVGRTREARALRRALSEPGTRGVALRYLEERAVVRLPYQQVAPLAGGWEASTTGAPTGVAQPKRPDGPEVAPSVSPLAAAELARLGLPQRLGSRRRRSGH